MHFFVHVEILFIADTIADTFVFSTSSEIEKNIKNNIFYLLQQIV